MQKVQELMIKRAKELLDSGEVERVIAWKKGETFYDNSPATFTKDNLEGFTYDYFCASNLSKYLVEESKKPGKILVFLKPCDTYSFNQLLSEHRINKDNIYAIAIECQGHLSERKIAEKFGDVKSVEVKGDKVVCKTADGEKTVDFDEILSIKCENCKSKEFACGDEKNRRKRNEKGG